MEDIEHEVKLRMQNTEKKYQKDIAVLQQKVELLNIQLQESKEREINSKKCYSKLLQTLNEMETHTKDATIRKLEEEILRLRKDKDDDTEILKTKCDEIVSMVQSSIKKDFEFFSSKRNSLVNELMKAENERSAKKAGVEAAEKSQLESLIKKNKRIKREQKELEQQNQVLMQMINKLEGELKTEKIVHENKLKDMDVLRKNEVEGFGKLKQNLETQIEDYKKRYQYTMSEMKRMLKGTHGGQKKIIGKINELISCGSVAIYSNMGSDKSPNKHAMFSPKMFETINRNFQAMNNQFNGKLEQENIGVIFEYNTTNGKGKRIRMVSVPKLDRLLEVSKKVKKQLNREDCQSVGHSEKVKKFELSSSFRGGYQNSTKTERLCTNNNTGKTNMLKEDFSGSIFSTRNLKIENRKTRKETSHKKTSAMNLHDHLNQVKINPESLMHSQSQISSQYILQMEESQGNISRKDIGGSYISKNFGFDSRSNSLHIPSKSSDYICKNLNEVFDDYNVPQVKRKSGMLKKDIETVDDTHRQRLEEECRDTPRLRGEGEEQSQIMTFAKRNIAGESQDRQEAKQMMNKIEDDIEGNLPESKRELFKDYLSDDESIQNTSRREIGNTEKAKQLSKKVRESEDFENSAYFIEKKTERTLNSSINIREMEEFNTTGFYDDSETKRQAYESQSDQSYINLNGTETEEILRMQQEAAMNQANDLEFEHEEYFKKNSESQFGDLGTPQEMGIVDQSGSQSITDYDDIKASASQKVIEREEEELSASQIDTKNVSVHNINNNQENIEENIEAEESEQELVEPTNHEIELTGQGELEQDKEFEMVNMEEAIDDDFEDEEASIEIKPSNQESQLSIFEESDDHMKTLKIQSKHSIHYNPGSFSQTEDKLKIDNDLQKQEIIFNLTETVQVDNLDQKTEEDCREIGEGTSKMFEMSNSKAQHHDTNYFNNSIKEDSGHQENEPTNINTQSDKKVTITATSVMRSYSESKNHKNPSEKDLTQKQRNSALVVNNDSNMYRVEDGKSRYNESDSEIVQIPITLEKKASVLNAYLSRKNSSELPGSNKGSSKTIGKEGRSPAYQSGSSSKTKRKPNLLIITNDELFQETNTRDIIIPKIVVNTVESKKGLDLSPKDLFDRANANCSAKSKKFSTNKSKINPLEKLQSVEIQGFDSMPPYNFESFKTSPKEVAQKDPSNVTKKVKSSKKIQNFQDMIDRQRDHMVDDNLSQMDDNLDDYNVMNESQLSHEMVEEEDKHTYSLLQQEIMSDENGIVPSSDDIRNLEGNLSFKAEMSKKVQIFNHKRFSEALQKNNTRENLHVKNKKSLKERIYNKVYESIKKKDAQNNLSSKRENQVPGSTAKRMLEETLRETKKYSLDNEFATFDDEFPNQNLKKKFDLFRRGLNKPQKSKRRRKDLKSSNERGRKNLIKRVIDTDDEENDESFISKKIKSMKKRKIMSRKRSKKIAEEVRRSKSYKQLFGLVKKSKQTTKLNTIRNQSLSQKARSLLNNSRDFDKQDNTPSRAEQTNSGAIIKSGLTDSKIQGQNTLRGRDINKDFQSFAGEKSSPLLKNIKNRSLLAGHYYFNNRSPNASPYQSTLGDGNSRKKSKSRYRCGEIKSGMIKHVSINLIDEENETNPASPINIKFGMLEKGVYQRSSRKVIDYNDSGNSSPIIDKISSFGLKFTTKHCRSENKINKTIDCQLNKKMGKTTRERRKRSNPGKYVTGLIAKAKKKSGLKTRSPRDPKGLFGTRTKSVAQHTKARTKSPIERIKTMSFIQKKNRVGSKNWKGSNKKGDLSSISSKYLESKNLRKLSRKNTLSNKGDSKLKRIKKSTTRKKIIEKQQAKLKKELELDLKNYQVPSNKYKTSKIPFNPLIDVTESKMKQKNRKKNLKKDTFELDTSLCDEPLLHYSKLLGEPIKPEHLQPPSFIDEMVGNNQDTDFTSYITNEQMALNSSRNKNRIQKRKLENPPLVRDILASNSNLKENQDMTKENNFYSVHDSIMMMHEILTDKVKDIETQISQRGDTENSFY